MGVGDTIRRLARQYAPASLMEWHQRRHNARHLNADPQAIFTEYYREYEWGHGESRSGDGSTVQATAAARELIMRLLDELEVRVFHDIPCGDFNWMRHIDFGDRLYIGSDIVPDLIEENRARYGRPGREFRVLNLISDALPRAELVLVRDCLLHLSYEHIFQSIRNLQASGSRYLLTNTYPEHPRNYDTPTGGARPINLRLPPFRFPEPMAFVEETKAGANPAAPTDKSLVLYRLEDLPTAPRA